MLSNETMRSNSQRPGKAVRVSRATCIGDRCFEKLQAGRREAGYDFCLPTIHPAHHAWMFAIDGKFRIWNRIGECHATSENDVSRLKLTCYQQRIAQRSLSHGQLRRGPVPLSQFNQVLGQPDRPRKRLAHQAGIPGQATGREPARGFGPPVR